MTTALRGYFGLGVEGVSKPYNVGNVFRTAHAFGASFVFTVAANYRQEEGAKVDTSDALASLPFYRFGEVDDMMLPKGCKLVGLEIVPESIDLPSFRHPSCAAYVLGAERHGLSPAMLARCDHVVKIPMRFSINLGMAGAIVLYDRLITVGRFAPRPVRSGGPTEALDTPVHGGPFFRASGAAHLERWRAAPPLNEVAEAREKD
ncbi:RNA methyltransferase [Rhodospirillum rubrum]|uniref:tRNA/rRNA methyltransferase (SpoU) n=1 Tax=Rhodospirillum rubrum (strain ATCC 11170 / ATH 1.1.1 / DSM 467 / LMG 4362 / NCIMB 8255 / S1) TaxID=269796 RepID=Q2RNX9_RHORT|nr:RNA methyltransferase [Rhodospirillum rubrum]ABC24166.1 tRNA/rRNA methyltransferase (SpoU) [Rhodospirillum rubrum ATCC 11170]AEO49917.1 tRNA/rRNA methyltransferase SpoU [Rhodospirillum rubrum F11]MBK5955879.1 rRNA methyltransferase [Rhodospirillum rubrum]QXG80105.1 RNA methyltransferase [Rhodospirillum rubrum]HAQ01349.1 TrmH family RNA methyltransferase [Rhodospirillum rubrum]